MKMIVDTLKTTFWMENLTQRWAQSGPFFAKSGLFFRFSKRAGEVYPLSPSSAAVNVTEYTSISLNMSKYPWKCLNKLLWLCYGSEYTWSYYMFDWLLKMHRVLNSHLSEYDTVKYTRVRQIPENCLWLQTPQ